jgi:hypothetical protein
MAKAAITVMLLVVLTSAGCSTTTNLVEVSNDIQNAGYAFASLHIDTSDDDTVVAVDATTATGSAVTQSDANKIAEIVWRKYNGSFSRLRIAINGKPAANMTEDDLNEKFGDRPDGLPTTADFNTRVGLVILGASGAGLILAGFVYFVRWRSPKPPPERSRK